MLSYSLFLSRVLDVTGQNLAEVPIELRLSMSDWANSFEQVIMGRGVPQVPFKTALSTNSMRDRAVRGGDVPQVRVSATLIL